MRKLTLLCIGTLLAGTAVAQPALRWKGFQQDTGRRDPALRTRTPGRSHVLVRFAANPGGDQLRELASRGATILTYIPDFAFSVSADDGTPLDGLSIQWAGRLLPEEKISRELRGALAADTIAPVVVEFHGDVDPNDVRSIAAGAGLVVRENPDVAANHLLVSGTAEQVAELSQWDEVAYIFPASEELLHGTPAYRCAGAITTLGPVGQAVALLGEGWDGPGKGGADLKYVFTQLTPKLATETAKSEIVRAFSEWAKRAKLTFTATSSKAGTRTLSILFASREHGDAYPFDGPGGALAHTFYPFPVNPEPIAGDLHFDDDESWQTSGSDIDLFSLALHETGHALGLGHSDVPGDVMYPYYHRATGLSTNDITAIQQIYAPQDGTPNPIPVGPLLLVVQKQASPTTASSVTLTGTAVGGTGILQVTWASNMGYAGVAQGPANWTAAGVPLNIGANVITVTLRDSQQNQVSTSLTITRSQTNQPLPVPPPSADTTAPSITITSPGTTNVSTSASSLVVSGTARDNVGVVAVTWSSSTGGSGSASGTANWVTPAIPLYIGTTTITIRASDAGGNTAWRSLTVTRR